MSMRWTPDRAARVWALAGVIVLSFWARHLTLTVPLSTQEYKWWQNAGGNLWWTSIPSRGNSNTPSRLHVAETGISFGSVWASLVRGRLYLTLSVVFFYLTLLTVHVSLYNYGSIGHQRQLSIVVCPGLPLQVPPGVPSLAVSFYFKNYVCWCFLRFVHLSLPPIGTGAARWLIGANLSFCSTKQLGVNAIIHGWNACPSDRLNPSILSGCSNTSTVPILICTRGWREALRD